MRRHSLLTIVFLSCPLAAQTPRVVVGPNVLVSQDGNIAHAELHVAAHPTDAQRLVGMATTVRDAGSKVTLELYASEDGGFTWKGSVPSHLMEKGGGDPIVGYGLHGTPLGVALGDHGMWVYRSDDNGFTWDNGVRAGSGDHERLGVDYSTGRYAGRMYLAAEVGDGRSTNPDSMLRAVHLWRSEDDGKSWIGPVAVAREATHGIAVNAMVVLSDGTVALFLNRYPNPSRDTTTQSWGMEIATSTDGGVTFTAPRAIGEHFFGGYGVFRRKQRAGRVDWPGGFDAAADTRGVHFRDRIYLVYCEQRKPNEGTRLVIRTSGDHGATWSAPRDLVPESRATVSQFQPAIAVNKDGTVGVMWYGTQEAPDDGWNLYFTASADGGESWTAPARVSSQSTVAFTAANDRPVPLVVSQAASGITVAMLSAFSRWPHGGDYLGLAADAVGIFHPMWIDGRSGLFEVYTSRIQVLPAGGLVAVAQGSPDTARREQMLNDKLTLEFDPVQVDWEKGELLVPVRLRNTSSDTLHGPFMVRIAKLGGSPLIRSEGVTEIVNATNGQRGVGAEFDYSAALRDMPYLAPHAVSEAVLWRVKPASMRHTDLSFTATVWGSGPEPKK